MADPDTEELITRLPLDGEVRDELVAMANVAFESFLERSGYLAVERDTLRAMWLLEDIDEFVASILQPDLLPLSKQSALLLAEVFIVHYITDFLEEAEKRGQVGS